MAYKNKTKFYRIPTLGYGDVITEEEEVKKMNIIDNLLYASTFGSSKYILEEGEYNLEPYDEGYVLTIKKPFGGKYNILGVVNYRLFFSTEEKIRSPKMIEGNLWFVYVEYNSFVEDNPTRFDLIAKPVPVEESNKYLLVAKVDLTDKNNFKIITDTDKIYAKNILAHTADNTNPHGKRLLQEELYLQGRRVYTSIYDKMNLFINAENKYDLPVDFVPVFATVYPENPNMGNISWKIKGNEIYFQISGLNSGTVNLKIEGYYKR